MTHHQSTHICQSPLVLELVLSRPLLGHEVVLPHEDLLQLSEVQDGDRLHTVAEHEAAQVLHIVDSGTITFPINSFSCERDVTAKEEKNVP